MGRTIRDTIPDVAGHAGVIPAPTSLPGVMRLLPNPSQDSRGSLVRLSCAATLGFSPRQTSLVRSPKRGTLRGMHFQTPPSAETKIVHCLSGSVFDAVIDLRADSPAYRRSVAIELSAEDEVGLLIPPGCAHGMLTLTDDVAVLYHMDHDYDPVRAAGVRWDDPAFGIAWPFVPGLMSDRDASWPDFTA